MEKDPFLIIASNIVVGRDGSRWQIHDGVNGVNGATVTTSHSNWKKQPLIKNDDMIKTIWYTTVYRTDLFNFTPCGTAHPRHTGLVWTPLHHHTATEVTFLLQF
jgi:hypothetical protein